MTYKDDSLRDALSVMPDCPPLAVLLGGEVRTPALEAHVAQCPNCRAELALFAKMEVSDDRAAVAAVANRLSKVNWAEAGRTGRIAEPAIKRQRFLRPGFFAPASLAFASLLVLVAVFEVNRPAGKPDFQVPSDEAIVSQHLRSGQLRGTAPLGVVQATPAQLRWQKVPEAKEYRARLMEVDHRSIWEGRSSQESITIPAETASGILPGKRMLWDVTAFDEQGKEIASSGTLEFTKSLH